LQFIGEGNVVSLICNELHVGFCQISREEKINVNSSKYLRIPEVERVKFFFRPKVEVSSLAEYTEHNPYCFSKALLG